MCDDDHHHCSGIGGVYQSLDEMDFARGPWNSAVYGDLPAIKKYLLNGGEPNLKDPSGYTPLHYAARAGNFHICKELLAFGANVDHLTKSGLSTALHRAAGNGQTATVKLLLENNANPCLVDDDGKTPLHKAAEGNHAETCRILVEAAPQARQVLDKRVKYPKDYVKCTDEQKDSYKLLWWSDH